MRALAALERVPGATRCPWSRCRPAVTRGDARRPRRSVRACAFRDRSSLRAPDRSWRLPRAAGRRAARTCRSGGSTTLAIGGAARRRVLRTLSSVGRPAAARRGVRGLRRARPGRPGARRPRGQRAARGARRSCARRPAPTNRVARLTVARATPERTTAEALAMGIDRRMSSYKTYYSRDADRITNLQLGVRALDGTLDARREAPSRSTTRSASARSSAASGRRP